MSPRVLAGVLLLPLLASPPALSQANVVQTTARASNVSNVNVPDPDVVAEALPDRAAAQAKTVGEFQVFYQFHFTDKLD